MERIVARLLLARVKSAKFSCPLPLAESSGLPLNPAPSGGMVRAPVVTQDPKAPEEDWEQRPGKSSARVVPDRDQPKVNDYVDSKVPPETITRLCDHSRPSYLYIIHYLP